MPSWISVQYFLVSVVISSEKIKKVSLRIDKNEMSFLVSLCIFMSHLSHLKSYKLIKASIKSVRLSFNYISNLMVLYGTSSLVAMNLARI